MTNDQKLMLVDHLTGTVTPLAPAMLSLGIRFTADDTLTSVRRELDDSIERCVVCSKWTDVDVMENRKCPRCDAVTNPQTEKPE